MNGTEPNLKEKYDNAAFLTVNTDVSDTEPFLRVRWIAPYNATWKNYIFYHGVAFDLASYLDQPLHELTKAASSL